MKKDWLEYETDTGNIVCLLSAEGENAPEVQSGHAVIAAPEEWDGDLSGWVVRDEELARDRTTPEARRERERLRRELAEEVRNRVAQVFKEFIVALLEDDADKQAELKAQYKRLKAFL